MTSGGHGVVSGAGASVTPSPPDFPIDFVISRGTSATVAPFLLLCTMIKVSRGRVWSSSKAVLLPMMVLSQVFGFAFAYGYGRVWMRVIHRIVIFTLLVLVFLHEVPSILFWLRASEGLHRTLVKVETSGRWSCFFFVYILTTFQSRKIKSIVEDLLSWVAQLPEDARFRIFRVHTLHLLFNILLIVAYDILGHDFVWSNTNHNSVTSIVYIFNDVIILWSAFLFMQIANVVREIFRDMNDKLKSFSSLTLARDVDSVRSEVVRFRHLHLHLYNTCKRLNSCFSAQLLSIIMFSVVQITYSLRAFISEVIRFDASTRSAPVILNIMWGAVYMLTVYQIAAIGDYTSFESKQSSMVVHHLINDHFECKGLEKELEIFSLQINQHEATFSIWLFELKFTLLNTLMGLLTTYMIILITFQEEWKQGGLSGWDFKIDG